MAYLRSRSQEFNSLVQWNPNTYLAMEYLRTFERQQHYLDGNLDPLFVFMARGGRNANQLNGMRFFAADIPSDATEAVRQAAMQNIASFTSIVKLNYFRSVAEYLDAAVFEQLPKPITDDEAIQERWAKESVPLIEKAHDAVFWFAAKGDGLLGIEHHVGPGMSVKPIPMAYDPQYWIPFTNISDRNLITGHTIMRPWFFGERRSADTLANRIRVDHIITPEQAANSDGLLPAGETRISQDYFWGGTPEASLQGYDGPQRESRIQKVWRFGRSDSIFVDMENIAFEAMMAMTFLRAIILRHPFPPVILPDEVSAFNLDSQNRFIMDPFDPIVLTSSLKEGSARAYDYAQNPAATLAAACFQWYEMELDAMAYAAHTPREAFGVPNGKNESGESVARLQQVFKTLVVYIRRNLKDIFREQWVMMGGPDIEIDWEAEPFAHGAARRAEIREDHVAGIISATTAQNLLGYPIDESMDEQAEMAAMPAGMMNGNSRAIEQGGNDMERGERTDG